MMGIEFSSLSSSSRKMRKRKHSVGSVAKNGDERVLFRGTAADIHVSLAHLTTYLLSLRSFAIAPSLSISLSTACIIIMVRLPVKGNPAT